jgi:hypothetical protein
MPARPWPGVTDVEVALARYGLDPDAPDGWLDGEPWPWLRDTARRRQLLPHLWLAVVEGDRSLAIAASTLATGRA